MSWMTVSKSSCYIFELCEAIPLLYSRGTICSLFLVNVIILNKQTPTSSAVGRMVIQIAYGERVWKAHGKELTELNDLCVEAFTAGLSNFWLVNIFEFCKTPFYFTWKMTNLFQYDSYLVGCQEQNFSTCNTYYSHKQLS